MAVLPISLWTDNLDNLEKHLGLLVDNLNQKGLAIWTPLSHFFGAALQHRRGSADSLELMRLAVEKIVSSGFLIRAPIYIGMLAEAALERGRIDLAQASISDALARADQQEEIWCQPELLRVRGLVEHRLGRHASAEDIQLRAVQTAERSGALFFQHRAAHDLANYWMKTDRRSAAEALLKPLCRCLPLHSSNREIGKVRRLLDQSGAVERAAARERIQTSH